MLPQIFKGIALFTPGGDLIYCIDPSKRGRWHMHLCVSLQELLGLSEPPHFLVPGYTATVDRWFDPRTREVKISAEIYPPVRRYQELLNAVFKTENLIWQTAPWTEEFCNPIVIETYRDRFPQLWQERDLIACLDLSQKIASLDAQEGIVPQLLENSQISPPTQTRNSQSSHTYVLRLFVSGDRRSNEVILERIYHLLERGLGHPYTLKVIDISKHPEQAETNHVSATPTLVRVWPHPVRRIVGQLEDIPRVLQILTSSS
ncbi:MAG: circadian clock KaiB family protein [Prochloraceae cyanobacterium]|nr:circadian clock KaiB family protein [Prochloraceae cyanobacterium]